MLHEGNKGRNVCLGRHYASSRKAPTVCGPGSRLSELCAACVIHRLKLDHKCQVPEVQEAAPEMWVLWTKSFGSSRHKEPTKPAAVLSSPAQTSLRAPMIFNTFDYLLTQPGTPPPAQIEISCVSKGCHGAFHPLHRDWLWDSVTSVLLSEQRLNLFCPRQWAKYYGWFIQSTFPTSVLEIEPRIFARSCILSPFFIYFEAGSQ